MAAKRLMVAEDRFRWLWIALGVIAADRASKYAIERWTSEDFHRELIPNVATLVHSVNAGVAFGFLSSSSSKWTSVLLIASSGAVVLLLVWMLTTSRGGDRLGQIGLALIAGGAAGNLTDRLLHGAVTDFLELRAGSFVWPTFNVADSAITIGAALLIVEVMRGGGHDNRRRAAERA